MGMNRGQAGVSSRATNHSKKARAKVEKNRLKRGIQLLAAQGGGGHRRQSYRASE